MFQAIHYNVKTLKPKIHERKRVEQKIPSNLHQRQRVHKLAVKEAVVCPRRIIAICNTQRQRFCYHRGDNWLQQKRYP